MKKIKTFEDACKALKITDGIPDVFACNSDFHKAIIAHYKLMIIAKALNGKWVPEWKNEDQWKYWPWFWMNDPKAPDGFSFDFVSYGCQYSYLGSRLCFKNEATAKYVATQFLDLYREYYVI